jgi:hypothetical protein
MSEDKTVGPNLVLLHQMGYVAQLFLMCVLISFQRVTTVSRHTALALRHVCTFGARASDNVGCLVRCVTSEIDPHRLSLEYSWGADGWVNSSEHYLTASSQELPTEVKLWGFPPITRGAEWLSALGYRYSRNSANSMGPARPPDRRTVRGLPKSAATLTFTQAGRKVPQQ